MALKTNKALELVKATQEEMAKLESQNWAADSVAPASSRHQGERTLGPSESSSMDGTILGLVFGHGP